MPHVEAKTIPNGGFPLPDYSCPLRTAASAPAPALPPPAGTATVGDGAAGPAGATRCCEDGATGAGRVATPVRAASGVPALNRCARLAASTGTLRRIAP